MRPRAPSGRSRGGPPGLDLDLWRRAKLLLLLNLLPLVVGLGIIIGWWQGRLELRAGSQHSLVAIGLVLGACVLFAGAVWIVLPLARWLRDYPLWRLRHGSRALWILPTIAGTVAWLGLALAGLVAGLGALAMIGGGLVHLFRG